MSRQQKSNSGKKPILQKANEVKRSMSAVALQARDIVSLSNQNRELKEMRPSRNEHNSASNEKTPELAGNAAVMNNILQQLSEEQEKRRYAEEQLSIKTIIITELEAGNQGLQAEANQWQEQRARKNYYQIPINEQSKRINRLINQSNEVQCQNRHLTDEKTLLQQNIDSLTQRIRELETENQRLQADANQWHQRADDLQRTVDEQGSRINAYQITVNEERKRINQLTNESNEVQCQNRHLTDEKTLLQQNIDSLTQRIRELETENQRLQADANQWHQRADDLQRTVDKQGSKINAYQITVNEERKRINQLTNESNEVQCQNRHLTDEKTLLQQNIDSLTQRIRELETENQRLQADANQWHQRADDLQRTVDKQGSKINAYQITVNEERKRINQLTNESNEVQCQNRHLTDEKTLLQQNIDSLTQRIRELETENQRLQADANQWRQRADDLQRTVDKQSSRINDFQRTAIRQTERINYLTDQKREIQWQNRHLTDERTLQQQNIDFLTQRIRELKVNSRLFRQRSLNGQNPDWILNRKEIIVSEQVLGDGGWGSVKTGKFRGTSVAVKQIHQLILSPHNRELFEREMAIASQCRHPCLLQFIGATNDNGSPLFVTEMLETDLRTLMSQMSQRPLKEKKRTLEEIEILRLCHDIACALNYLHMMHPVPIIHRDLSSSNILLWHEGNRLRAKISDYGAANFMMVSISQNPGAVLYSAPEAGTPQQSTKVGK